MFDRYQREIHYLRLSVTDLCNLRCRYCFAGQGGYGGTPKVMSLEVAKAAIDFLIDKSVGRWPGLKRPRASAGSP